MRTKNLVVATAQQQMRLFDTLESFRKELSRFLHMAQAKGAELVVFPALSGVMAATPVVTGFRVQLLKRAEGERRQGSLWARTRGAIASSTAGLLGASFRKAFIQVLDQKPDAVLEAYETTFAELACSYKITVVAGSAYLRDASGVIRHTATVFGPDGAILGRHHKVILSVGEEDLAVAGDGWTVVPTPVGPLGILLGEEALYPEVGRILVHQGAALLVTLAATRDEVSAAYLRQATLARSQENRCFATASFLVGRDYLAPSEEVVGELSGRSAIYAPLELTLRYTGVLVEMGASGAEGMLTADLDLARLSEIRAHAAGATLGGAPTSLFASYLPALYGGEPADVELATRPEDAPESEAQDASSTPV